METLTELGNKLIQMSNAIDKGTMFLNDANNKYLLTKVLYENEVDKAYLKHKASEDRVSDTFATAKAEEGCYELKLAMVKAESHLESLKNTLRAKRDKFEALRVQNDNLRAEIKKFNG